MNNRCFIDLEGYNATFYLKGTEPDSKVPIISSNIVTEKFCCVLNPAETSQLYSALRHRLTDCCAEESHSGFKSIFFFFLQIRIVYLWKKYNIISLSYLCYENLLQRAETARQKNLLSLQTLEACGITNSQDYRFTSAIYWLTIHYLQKNNSHIFSGLLQEKFSQMWETLYKVSGVHSAQVLRLLDNSSFQKLIWCLLICEYLRMRRLRTCQYFKSQNKTKHSCNTQAFIQKLHL